MKYFRRIVATCAVALFLNSAAAAEPFPLPLWYSLDQPEAHQLETMISDFEASHSHLDVQPRNFASSEELCKALETAENPPVFAIVEGDELARLDRTTKLTEVEEWMPRDQFLFSWSVKHDVYGALFEGSSVEGRLMARPLFYTTSALIYDADMLQKKGVKAAPVTWADLDLAADKLRDETNNIWGFAFENEDDVEEGLSLMMHQGADLEADGGEGAIKSVLQLGQDMAKSVSFPEDGGYTAMRVGTVGDFLRLKKEGYPVRTAGVPGPDAKHRRTDFHVRSLGMFPVAHSDLYKAQEFAFWLTDFNQQRVWAENTDTLAAHVKVFDNPFYRQARSEEHNDLRTFVTLLGRADMAPSPTPDESQRMSTLLSVFPQIAKGEMDLASALKMFAVAEPAAEQTDLTGSTTNVIDSESADVQNPK